MNDIFNISLEEILNPYANEHAARLRDPDDFADDSFRRTHGSGDGRVQGVKIPETIDVIWGKLKGKDKPKDPVLAQALRFPTDNWTEAEARKWLSENEIEYMDFEAASDEKKSFYYTREKNMSKTKQVKRWWSMDVSPEVTDVFIYDEIGYETKNFVKELGKITSKTIRVRMNTPGGSVFDGHAIYNALKMHKAKVEIIVEGLAASAGSTIVMAGDTIKMAKNAFLMIHNPYMLTIGEADDLRRDADLLDKIRKTMIDTYAARTNNLKRDIGKWLDEETWFSAKDAKEKGFADEIIDEEPETSNAFDLSNYKNVPLNLVHKFENIAKSKPTERETEQALRDAGFSRRDAKSILSGGFDVLRDAVDNNEEEEDLDELILLVQKRNVFKR